MKTNMKKLVGGFMVVMVIATIGAVIASAQTDDTSEEENTNGLSEHRRHSCGEYPSMVDLTVEQREELEAIRTSLQAEDATHQEIMTAIQEKLEEFGVDMPTFDEQNFETPDRDGQLDSRIEQTEQQLEQLYRTKELREQGYEWEEIQEIILEEFDLEYPVFPGFGMGGHHGFLNGDFHDDWQSLDSELSET